jgi:5-formyltetrahydrofolate cyclo-ligase
VKNVDLAAEKDALRARFRAARIALSEEDYAAHSAAVCERIAALPEIGDAETVHIYWPLVDRRELDTRPLIRRLDARGQRVVLPVVAAFDGAPRLRHVAFAGEGRMRPNRWGILEPHETPEVDPSALGAVVVPAFGAGRDGHRIGHGRGFYDSFLAGIDAPAVGAVFAGCLVERVPAEAHDVPLDVVVTEREVVRFPPRAPSGPQRGPQHH